MSVHADSKDRPTSRWRHFLGLDRLSAQCLETHVRAVDVRQFKPSSTTPQIAWLGHASFLITWHHKTLLVDPVFARYLGPIPRRVPVSDSLSGLAPDAILLSHGHMDHLNNSTLARFPRAPIFLPRKSETFLRPDIRKRASALDLGREHGFGTLTITPVPARHGGWRYPWQQGYSAFGYLISDRTTTVYFAGDTAFGNHFKQIRQGHTIDIALLPIGAYSPSWFLKSRHLNPEEAIRAAKDLGAKTTMPCHFGSYRVALEPLNQALPRFAREAGKQRLNWVMTYDFS